MGKSSNSKQIKVQLIGWGSAALNKLTWTQISINKKYYKNLQDETNV
jgi:hypothetical protein